MSVRTAFIKWAILGAVVSGLLIGAQSAAVDGIEGLLQVGDTSSLRPIVEEQLGTVPLAPGPGHDGQIYYAIGLDLDGDEIGPLLDHAAYRYRRILFPLVSSGFGLLDGRGLLIGMIVVTVLSAGLAAGAVAATAVSLGLKEWAALTVLLNPGVWLAVRLLTSDTPAIASMALGLFLVVRLRRRSEIPFALSVLAKDVYLVTPGGLALSRDRRQWFQAAVPLLVLVGWMVWLTVTLGEGFAPRGNLALPLVGLFDGSVNWPALDAEEWLYLGFALLSVLLGLLFGLLRRSWLRWPILGWSALAIVSSNWVWDFGNNAARAFAPIVVLVALGWIRSDPDTQADAGNEDTSETAER